MEKMLTTNPQTSPGQACRASRQASCPAGTVPENPQPSYYRARYYVEFESDDPNFYGYVGNDPGDWRDPDGTQRDRGTTGRPDGTPNPFKHMKPDPDDPNKVIRTDPKTGKKFKSPKPPGFQPYWDAKHPPKPVPKECPGTEPKPDPKKPMKFDDGFCHGAGDVDCIRHWYDDPNIGPLFNPNLPGVPLPWRSPFTVPFRLPEFAFPG